MFGCKPIFLWGVGEGFLRYITNFYNTGGLIFCPCKVFLKVCDREKRDLQQCGLSLSQRVPSNAQYMKAQAVNNVSFNLQDQLAYLLIKT